MFNNLAACVLFHLVYCNTRCMCGDSNAPDHLIPAQAHAVIYAMSNADTVTFMDAQTRPGLCYGNAQAVAPAWFTLRGRLFSCPGQLHIS